jgi:hypothetical protein
MVMNLRLDPELAAVVERARRRVNETGELTRGPFPTFESTIPPEATDGLVDWLRDGGYDDAISRITREDPDLANQ